MMQLPMTFEGFFNWIALHQPDESVGLPGRCFHSPLALYLSALAGRTVGVDEKRYGRALSDGRYWVELPRWAQIFTGVCERYFGSEINAYEAVGLLVEVEAVLVPVLVV